MMNFTFINATSRIFLGLFTYKEAVCLLYLTLDLSGGLKCFRKDSPIIMMDHGML